jgi:hypothetical protein
MSSSSTGAVELYDIATGERLRTVGMMSDWFLSMAIDPNDKFCVCTDYARNMVVFKLDSTEGASGGEGGNIQCAIPLDSRPSEDICSLAFVERGGHLCGAHHSENIGQTLVAYLAKDTVYFLDVEAGEEVRSFRILISGSTHGLWWTLHFIRDGSMCVSCDDASVQWWSKVCAVCAVCTVLMLPSYPTGGYQRLPSLMRMVFGGPLGQERHD